MTYTLAADGLFDDPESGVSFRYHAGDVVPLDLAIRLGMPGAVAPAPTDPFGPAESTWLEARLTAFAAIVEDLITAGIADALAALTLGDVADVVLTAPADGDQLTYDDGSESWVNTAPAA